MYQLLTVTGADAETFLQGQLTQDVTHLTAQYAAAAAWCNPKGRVIANMRIIKTDEWLGLVLPASIATTVLQKISIYRLRSDVQLAITCDWHGIAVQADTALRQLEKPGLLPQAMPNATCGNGTLNAICISSDPFIVEVFGSESALDELHCEAILDELCWRSALIRSGNVRIDVDNSEKYTPHMLSLDLAGAVSFDKGCYTGQEVVARTEHRGRSRRRLARFECAYANTATGDELFAEHKAVGTVVNVSGEDVLAVTPSDLAATTLTLHGEPAKPVALPWDTV